ncbi:SRPBCC family protein [Psychrobacillus sp. INOP01]|uniref:SRPBCC family protein n=1 Tax=Psychrobacillus sp. INOP01 TaxID=2829187 RepID=UPI001BA79A47|nr:SRPBCC family protein [Psychrobacillus sp. INOP01]QUG41547.1 SRPBCC family protein [Psychrobacillus sp. INOP01]
MKKWKKEILLNVPIEFAWAYFYGDISKKKKIFPKVVGEEIIKQTEGIIGTIISQSYQTGSLTEQYEITIKKYTNESNYKAIQESFLLNNRFKMTTEYELESQSDKMTKFIYTSINKPKNPLLSIFQLFGSDEVIVNFLNKAKIAIEMDFEQSQNNEVL